jgi:hypothetical protein
MNDKDFRSFRNFGSLECKKYKLLANLLSGFLQVFLQ